MDAPILIGTSGWSYPHWRGPFYPPGLAQRAWFAHYARHFPTVEINASFYRLPSEATTDHWRDAAPPGFVYAVKASRYLTHVKRLADCAAPLATFLGRVRRLGPHLGPILYQLPPNWKPVPERLAQFARLLPPDLVHVFEFRDARWFTDEIRRILADHDLAFCRHDHHAIACPAIDCPDWRTGPVGYFRWHGSTRAPDGGYSAAELDRAADLIAASCRGGRPAYVYFNNDAHGRAVANATDLQRLIAGPAPNGPVPN